MQWPSGFRRSLPVVLILAFAACDPAARVPQVAVGNPAPSYTAITLDGDSVSLAQFRGQVVLLNLWATWCFPCREEIPELQQLHEQFGAEGLEVVGVSIDSRGAQQNIRQFADELGVTYRIWHDPDSRITNKFLVYGVPTTFLIDREGVIRWRHMGPVQATDRGLRDAMEQAGVIGSRLAARE